MRGVDTDKAAYAAEAAAAAAAVAASAAGVHNKSNPRKKKGASPTGDGEQVRDRRQAFNFFWTSVPPRENRARHPEDAHTHPENRSVFFLLQTKKGLFCCPRFSERWHRYSVGFARYLVVNTPIPWRGGTHPRSNPFPTPTRGARCVVLGGVAADRIQA